MRSNSIGTSKLVAVIGAAALALSAAVVAQQSQGIPRTADGHPDLSGTWDNGAGIDFVRPTKDGESVCIFGCASGAAPPPAAGPAPRQSPPQYRPELAAKVADLDKRHPGLRERICEADGSVRRFVNLYVNGDDIRFLSNLDSAVKDGDEVSIVPAIAGGL